MLHSLYCCANMTAMIFVPFISLSFHASGHLRCLFELDVPDTHLSVSTAVDGRGGGWGITWLEEVTMRYGGEEGRLFDPATHWCSYNGNRSDAVERVACLKHAHIHLSAHKLKLHTVFLPREYQGAEAPWLPSGLR